MAHMTIDADEVEIGDQITVYYGDGNCGQGGVVVNVSDEGILIRNPLGTEFSWGWDEVVSLAGERALPADECLEFSDECRGPVEMHTTGRSDRAWPRCQHHAEKRQERYENSSERFADSDVPPADFHRGWGGANEYGEHWSEDDY